MVKLFKHFFVFEHFKENLKKNKKPDEDITMMTL